MENVILGVFLIFILLMTYSILKASKPFKCPKCGEYMELYYCDEFGMFYYECPNCGHKEVYHG